MTLKPLSGEWVERAREELGEEPELNLERCHKLIADLEEERPDINFDHDPNFIIKFLRAKKFDLARAKTLLISYYEMKETEKSIFEDLMPSMSLDVLDRNLMSVLPGRDKHGRRVILLNIGQYNPDDFTVFEFYRAIFMLLEVVALEPETQVSGISVLADFDGFGWKQFYQFSNRLAQLIVSTLQQTFPARFKALVFLNAPSLMSSIVWALKQLMTKKMSDRLAVQSYGFDPAIQQFGPEIVPVKLGGELRGAGHYERSMALVLSHEDYFLDMLDFGITRPETEEPGTQDTDPLPSSQSQ